MSLSFELKGDKPLIAKLQSFPGVMPKVTRAIAEALKGIISRYPGPVHKPIQWASPAQRTAYIAQRRAAGLGPYRRQSDPFSQRLGPSWATQNRGNDAVVGTRVTYAPWVQDSKRQQPMHKATGWITDAEAIQKGQEQHIEREAWDRVIAAWDK